MPRQLAPLPRELPPECLAGVYDAYEEDKDIRERRLEEVKWKVLFMLQGKLLDDPSYRHVRIVDGDNALYEVMFRSQPDKYMTRPQYLTAMRRVFSFPIANLDSLGDQPLLRALNNLFDGFDEHKRDQIDWRSFVMLMNLMLKPRLKCHDQLEWAFNLYSSRGSFDRSGTEPVALRDIKDFMKVPASHTLRLDINDLVDAAWISLANSDPEAQMVASAAKRQDQVHITKRMFSLLLEQPVIRPLMEVEYIFGPRDPRPWTFVYERRFFHPHLYSYLKDVRRRARNIDMMEDFVSKKSLRIKRLSFRGWLMYMQWRENLRHRINQMFVLWMLRSYARVMDRWRRKVLERHASTMLQRATRGFNARQQANDLRLLHACAERIQTWYRAIYGMRVWIQYKVRRDWAAVELQRRFRSMVAKRLFKAKKESVIERVVREREERIKRVNKRRLNVNAQRIQNWYRHIKTRIRLVQEAERKIREEAVARDMMKVQVEYQRQQGIYQKRVEKYYRTRKEEEEKMRMQEHQTAREKIKILGNQKRRENQERSEKQRRKEALQEALDEERAERFLAEWEVKKEEMVSTRVRDCNRSLDAPEDKEDKLLRKKLRDAIKKQTKKVLRRADKMKIPMEVPEAQTIARNDVIKDEARIAKKQAEAAFQEAARVEEDLIQNRYKRIAIEEKARYERMREDAAHLLQDVWREYAARRVRRQLAYERYRKHFDPKTGCYFYEDKRTHETMWDKPKSFGRYDLDVQDEWVIMFDDVGTHFYYNPRRTVMTWDAPFGTIICNVCKVNFCTLVLLDMQNQPLQPMCNTCFTTYKDGLDAESRENVRYVELDGRSEDAKDVNIDSLEVIGADVYRVPTSGTVKAVANLVMDEDDGAMCAECMDQPAVSYCMQCDRPYCQPCYDDVHKRSPFDMHTAQDIAEYLGAGTAYALFDSADAPALEDADAAGALEDGVVQEREEGEFVEGDAVGDDEEGANALDTKALEDEHMEGHDQGGQEEEDWSLTSDGFGKDEEDIYDGGEDDAKKRR